MTSMTSMTSMTGRGSAVGLGALAGLNEVPLVAEALITSRDRNSADPLDCPLDWVRKGQFAERQLPDFDDPEHLRWWQAEVRGHLCAQELQSGLLLECDASPAAHPGVRLLRQHARTLDLKHLKLDEAQRQALGLQPGQTQLAVAQPLPLARIDRPSRGVFDRQVEMVIAHADSDLRRSRAPEILAQIVPQVPFWASVVPLSPWRTPFTYEFIGIALKFGMEVTHRFKHALAVLRPSELSPLVQPMIQTPGWSSLPSGHATEAFMFARLMLRLLGQPEHDRHGRPTQLWQTLQMQAASIANNRVYAGLHYPIDGVAGRLLGDTLGEYVHAVCTGAGWRSRAFLGAKVPEDLDLDIGISLDDGDARYFHSEAVEHTPPANRLLAKMWALSTEELKKRLGFL